MADGSITAVVDLDDKNAQQQLTKLKKTIESLELDTKVKEATKARLEAEMENIRAAYKAALQTDDAALQQSLEKQYDSLASRIANLNEKIKENGDAAGVLREQYGEIASGVSGFLAIPAQALGAAAQRLPGLLKGAFSTGAKAAAEFGKGVANAAKQLNVFGKAADAIGPKLKKLSGMVKRVFVFSVMSAGLRQLRSTISSFLEQSAALTLAVNRTKAALTTAFMPIYEAVVPALETLLNVITRVLGALAQFNAMLFGTTAKAAQANAKALTEQADATKAAGGAAKKAGKELAAFDEINKLSESSDGGGGASGGAEVAGFDVEFDDAQIESWGQAFSDALDGIIEKVNQLPGIFAQAAESINGFFKKVLDALTFPGVQDKVSQLGRDLATALNGLAAQINWYTIGAALGAGLNLALSLLIGFIYNFDWIQLGGSLARMINGIVDQVDWYNFGKLLWAGYKIAIEFLAGLLLRLDMKKLAEAASNIALGFFGSMTQTVKAIPWGNIGKQISTFLQNIEWNKIGASVAKSMNAIVEAIKSFVANIEWAEIASSFTRGVNTFIQGVDWKNAGKMIYELFRGVLTFMKTTVIDFDWAGLGRSIGDFILGINWGKIFMDLFEIGAYLMLGLFQGIGSLTATIGSWVKEHIVDPFVGWIKDLFGINSPSKVMEELGEFISAGLANGIENGVGTIKGVLNAIIETVEKAINWCVEKLNKLSFKAPDWVPEIGGKKFGVDIPKVTIPRLAAGAVIPPNREFMAVLGDQSSGNNIEAPEALLRQMAQEAAGANTSLLQEILSAIREGKILMVYDDVFARVVREANASESSRRGVPLVQIGGASY